MFRTLCLFPNFYHLRGIYWSIRRGKVGRVTELMGCTFSPLLLHEL